MVTRINYNLYEIIHTDLEDVQYVIADSVQDAVEKFNKYWQQYMDINGGEITSVKLKETLKVII